MTDDESGPLQRDGPAIVIVLGFTAYGSWLLASGGPPDEWVLPLTLGLGLGALVLDAVRTRLRGADPADRGPLVRSGYLFALVGTGLAVVGVWGSAGGLRTIQWVILVCFGLGTIAAGLYILYETRER